MRRDTSEIVFTAPHEAAAYRLEGTLHLGDETVWTPVTTTPIHTAEGMEYRLPLDGPAQFFRMAKE